MCKPGRLVSLQARWAEQVCKLGECASTIDMKSRLMRAGNASPTVYKYRGDASVYKHGCETLDESERRVNLEHMQA